MILSGGAINSPQLLQLSGIGPGALLQRHGIPVRAGQCQCRRPHAGPSRHQLHLAHDGADAERRAPALVGQAARRAAVHSHAARAAVAVASTRAAASSAPIRPSRRPNMQLYMQAFSTLIPKDGERPLLTPDPFSGLSLGLSNCRPTSTGAVEIQSPDPFTHPRLTFQCLWHGSRCRRDAGGGEVPAGDRGAGAACQGLMAEELRPGPAVRTDEELICMISASAAARSIITPAPAAWGRIRRLRRGGCPAARAWH